MEQLTKKQRNLESAKKNYLNKKKERYDLEKTNQDLVQTQMTLIDEITYLTEKARMAQLFLQRHKHDRSTCTHHHVAKKGTHPKRKWNETYLNEISAKQQKLPHPNVRINLQGNNTVSVH